VVVAGLIGAIALIVVASVAPRDAGHGQPDPGPFGTDSSKISSDAATTSVLVAPIRVESEFGTAIIAGHIMCRREDALPGNSVVDVQAAVAADNDSPPVSGGGQKPYAHDGSAQREIVRASIQELHDDDHSRFFADCAPVPTAETGTSNPPAAP
jgi:hypothetical protein